MNASADLNVVALSPNDWFGQWMNRQYLLSRVGRRHRVVYSMGAWTIWDRTSEPWRRARVFGRAVPSDNVVVEEAPRFLLRWPTHAWIDNVALCLHAWRLRRLATLGGSGPTVAVLFHPGFYPYLRFLRPAIVAYHAYDLFADTPDWNPKLEVMENALLRMSNLVSTVTPAIAQRLGARVHRDIRILPNGVDLDAFARTIARGNAMPLDLAQIPRPRIGYLGSLHPQVDYGLVAELANRQPTWNFVFVGGKIEYRHVQAERELEACRALPNVHFLGAKERGDVPGYALNMDVNIMCYRLSEGAWVKAGYPLKLNEYLAAGAPIVSSDLDAVRAFSPLVRIAGGVGDWEQALAEALSEDAPGLREARRARAQESGWDERARQWSSWLDELAPARPTGVKS